MGFGAEPSNLITATLMAAPAALAFSKLFYPETEKSLTTFKDLPPYKSWVKTSNIIKISIILFIIKSNCITESHFFREDSSLLDAGIKGAINGIPIVLGITANIIAFTSFVAFLNGLLSWIGGLVGFSELTFEVLINIFLKLII